MLVKRASAVVVALLTVILYATSSVAQTTTTVNFTAQIIIQDECNILTTATLDFGTEGVLDANVDATADFTVQCTSNTAYRMRLDNGSTTGGTTTTRLMTDGVNTVQYQMFRDSARTLNWGDNDGFDTNDDTGTGAVQTHTIYGRVPAQTTPPAATYTDTVTITVAY